MRGKHKNKNFLDERQRAVLASEHHFGLWFYAGK